MKEGLPKQIETPNRNSLIETIKPLIIPALMILGTVSWGGDLIIQGGKSGVTFLGTVGPILLSFGLLGLGRGTFLLRDKDQK